MFLLDKSTHNGYGLTNVGSRKLERGRVMDSAVARYRERKARHDEHYRWLARTITVILGVMAACIAWIAMSGRAPYECHETRVIASAGDSLWSIAERYCDGQVDAVVDTLAKRYGTTIYPTQEIQLPVHD